MEKPMNYILKLSLEEMALRKISVTLWSGADILDSLAKISYKSMNFRERRKKWDIIHRRVKRKVLKMGLPVSLRKQMMRIIDHIGSEIGRWKRFHEICLNDSIEEFDVQILEKLYWTSLGTVDYRKTAEVLISSELLDIVSSYKLACLYCLEEYISCLWENLPKDIKDYSYNSEGFWDFNSPFLEFCWPYILKGEEAMIDNMLGPSRFHWFGFKLSALGGNKSATKYFFNKLSLEDKETAFHVTCEILERKKANIELTSYQIISVFPEEKFPDILLYLLSLLSSKNQEEILKQYPFEIISSFVVWPFQDYLDDITTLIMTCLPKSSYEILLRNMAERIRSIRCYFPSLFQKFFLNSPSDCRKKFLDHDYESCTFFAELLRAEDMHSIRVILRNIDSESRTKLAFSYNFFQILDIYVDNGKWNLVKLCICEAVPSKANREDLKDTFMGFLSTINTRDMRRRRRTWASFFRSLDRSKSAI